MYALVRSTAFERSLRKFLRKHPAPRRSVAEVLRELETGPFQPGLKTHSSSGGLRGTYAVSVCHAYRIRLEVHTTEREITLIDIGGHDEVYR